MKRLSLRRSILLPVFALMLPLLNAQASSGVIHFQGAIVEEGCYLSPQEQSVKFSCSQNGQPVVQTVSYNKLNNFVPHSDAIETTQIRYLDAQHKLAIVEVTYR